MKNYNLIILFLVLVLTQTVSLTAQTNLVVNGGFENVDANGKPGDWTLSTMNSTWTLDTDIKYEGTQALKFATTMSAVSCRYAEQKILQGVEAGGTYNFSFWYYVYDEPTADGGVHYYINFLDAGGVVIQQGVENILLPHVKDDWMPCIIEATAPVGAVGVWIKIGFNRKVGAIIDDVQFVKTEIVKQDQTIEGLTDIVKTVGDPDFELTAAATSGLPVSYSLLGAYNIASISGNTVHIIGTGTCTIIATQEGDDEYKDAPEVRVNLTVNAPAKQDQTITGLVDITKTLGDDPFDLTATASSGLAVLYASSNTGVATVSGSSVRIISAGTTTITATQSGNDTYNPAMPVTATLTVNPPAKQSQTISGLVALTKTVGDADFDLSAVASSSLPVSYTSSNTAVATVSGSTVHIVGAGETTITASQAGDDSYHPATPVTAVLTVNPAPKQAQSITGLAAITKTVGDADFELSAVASSGLPVSYTSSNAAVATVSGSTVHIVGAGETVITASQAGNDSFEAAPNVTVTLTVSKQSQSITGLADLTKMLSDAPFELSAVASSGLAVSYTSSDATVATVSGSTVTLTGAGTTVITASQAGDDSFAAAPNVTATLTVTDNTGIADVKAPLPVRRQGDDLVVGGAAAGSRIDVYTVIGRRQQSAVSAGGDTVLSGLPKGELLIVRSGNAVAKVIL